MKKTLGIVLSMLSVAVAAQNVQKQPEQRPMLNLAVYDTANKVAKPIGTQYSVGKKGQQLCWVVINMPFQARNSVTEIFHSPAEAQFGDPAGTTVSSEDKKRHQISMTLPSSSNEFIQRCWRFDHRDPLGQYTLEVRVNDIVFPAQRFELIK
ncbi:hypothetical protein [Glaesserella sp.]|uniref:hypothetical protein n=1 Tax=Glaesserella sp. TaxID=2094731 RepID=UPI0035A0C30D